MKIMKEAFRVGYDCGRPVLAEVLRGGERLGTLIYFFDEEDGVAYDERTTRCPGCGRRLDVIAILRQSS